MAKKRFYPVEGFAERLSQLAYDKGLSAQKLAKIGGVRDRKTAYSWLHGGAMPNGLVVARLCCHFKVSADWLLFGKGDTERG